MIADRSTAVSARKSGTEEEVQRLRAEIADLRRALDERERVNAALIEAVEHFVSAVAHDLKNPIAAIKITVQGLQRAARRGTNLTSDQLTERLDRIETSVGQMLEYIAAARARLQIQDDDGRPLRAQPVDLVALTQQLIERFRSEAAEHVFKVESTCPLLMGNWDSSRLERAIQRLLDNAAKFSPPGSEIAVEIERHPAEAVLRVRDQGIGIPDVDLPHIFKRFHRGQNVLGRYKGAGLGLFEAHSEVSRHGGTLQAEAREGAGCAMTLRLPTG
ncbi:MAG: HAMP domain-containing histidine kinase [Chloroflexi bacterium]|nr:HAMP domain-containing histidine kinase [Chloroflexota bacterium]